MIHLDKGLANEACRIVELKGNADDIKASKDLQEIRREMRETLEKSKIHNEKNKSKH